MKRINQRVKLLFALKGCTDLNQVSQYYKENKDKF